MSGQKITAECVEGLCGTSVVSRGRSSDVRPAGDASKPVMQEVASTP